ncbi:MAG: hypothetical protein ACRDTG_22740 [Pseudonocardiaceae bacterium]
MRGNWRSAATGWAELGDPYEQALELAWSGEIGPTLEALHMLEDLGATAAAIIVRRRLRRLGVHRIPRRSHSSTRANPAGLTQRQLDVLMLLEVRTRREAAAVARSWNLAASPTSQAQQCPIPR